MDGLQLFTRVSQSATGRIYLGDLSSIATRYRHKSHRIGGFTEATFTLTQAMLSSSELIDFYNQNIGCRLEERTLGLVSWEGYIEEMRLYTGGVEHMISIAPQYCRNRIRVLYSDDIGTRSETAYSENTDSSDIFGEINWIESLAGTTADGATSWRDTYLTTHAWPRSRIVGGDAREQKTNEPLMDELRITCKGYWSSIDWRYRQANTTDTASNLISLVVAASEFVTDGRVETNAIDLHLDGFPVYRRENDLLTEVIEQGDASGNLWEGGVYAGRLFVYEQADTEWIYQLRDNVLLNQVGTTVLLSLVKPGFLLYSSASPVGWVKPGTSSDWDDPKIGYVDQIDFVRGVAVDELRMHYFGTPPSAHVLARQLRKAAPTAAPEAGAYLPVGQGPTGRFWRSWRNRNR